MSSALDPLKPHAAPASRRAALAWMIVYGALFGVLGFGVLAGLRLRCEGFGCMGVGIYWFAWAGLYGIAGVLGLWARSYAVRAGVTAGWMRLALWTQGLGGLGLLAYWLSTR